MDKKELIEKIRKLKIDSPVHTKYFDGWNEALDIVLDLILNYR